MGGSGDRILIAAVTLRASAVGAGPVAAAGYAPRPEPRGPRFALPPARLSGRGACAGSPTRGSLRRQRRLGCHTIQRQLHRQRTRRRQHSDPLGVATRPPASSFRARIQARRSRRLPPIPDAPHGHGLAAPPLHSQPYSDGPRVSSHRAPGVQSPGLPGLVLPPGRGSLPCVRRRTVAGGLSAEASSRKACHTPSSLRELVAVSLWQARRRFHIPGVAAPTAATRIDTGSHSRRVHAHAIAAPEPACHTALSGDMTRRTCGRPCGRCQSLALGGSRPHPDRYGRRRSFAAAASVSASAPAAASQAPCVPDALAADLTSPVWQPPPLRVERLPRDGCHTRFPCGSPMRGTKPGGLVPLPDPLPQQFNQQSNKQIQIITGRVTHPPAASFRARIQARRSRRLPPIPDAPHCYGLHASAACVRTPYLHRTFR